MSLPENWWLLAMTVAGQAVFFLRHAILRFHTKEVQPFPRWALVCGWTGTGAGMAYGAAQSDPVFVTGQACVAYILFRLQRQE
ncbi:lipid A biosynthesis domain-containing protein [Pseudodesulfovibrio tunisiensis]|uniref:lipid A biosynthesis domain-containing protein n=1 Tax=Pseudodesulfovibrio tunisiensis TaxID=463192 RepID=UPI001FB37406|nr:lipid A biosynthesis domain-containing protein [Pseudodesulfovibrio tunisiensis]